MEEHVQLQQTLVDELRTDGVLHDARVEAAFRAVPRHVFLPDLAPQDVYRDQAIVTKRIDGVGVSSSSQPAVMAVMLQQLNIRPGQRVLEIGAGTGYNAALLAQLVGGAGHVVTVDIDCDIVQAARQHLSAAGFERVEVVRGDGGLGYPAGAPYDRIILTVGAWDIAPAWWEQLRMGGRLVLPLALGGPGLQRAIAFDRMADHLASADVRPCGFMPLRGAFAGPAQAVPLGSSPGLRLVHEPATEVDAAAVVEWLGAPGPALSTGVRANVLTMARGLNLWIALADRRYCSVTAEANAADAELVPPLHGHGPQSRSTIGLLGERGLALLSWVPDQAPATAGDDWSPRAPSFELEVRGFGAEAGLARRLADLVMNWEAAGRPSSDSLRVRAYRRGTEPPASGNTRTLTKNWTSLMLDWT
jgi:protein-L-isoaspartate(D-aspartate) O-methyltransferase